MQLRFPGFFLLILLGSLAMTTGCGRADPPALPDEVLQASSRSAWYRGNLHAHSRWSDGDAEPDVVAGWYSRHGYHFLALSDHNRFVDGRPLPASSAPIPTAAGTPRAATERIDWAQIDRLFSVPGKFLLLPAEEISDLTGTVSLHVNAFGLRQTVQPSRRPRLGDALEANLVAAASAADPLQGFAQVNHPNFLDAMTAEHLMRMKGTPLFEIYNGHPLSNNSGDGLRPSTERMWDIALAWRLGVLGLPPLYGTATDDSHNFAPGGDAAPGRGWVMVLADELTPAQLAKSMHNGRFYASTGVRLRKIVATHDRLEVEVNAKPGAEYAIEFIGTRRGFDRRHRPASSALDFPIYATSRYGEDIGEVFKRETGTHGRYRFDGDDLYVRARITSSRRHPNPSQAAQMEQAWVQPHPGPAAAMGRQGDPRQAPPLPYQQLHGSDVTHAFQPIDGDRAKQLQKASSARCNLDLLQGAAGQPAGTADRKSGVIVAGWLSDRAGRTAPNSFVILLQGESNHVAEGGLWRYRPDVAKFLDSPALESAGFHSALSLVRVPPGKYHVSLAGVSDGEIATCNPNKTLKIAP